MVDICQIDIYLQGWDPQRGRKKMCKTQMGKVVVKLKVSGLRLGVDFTFTLDNNDNDNHNPHLNFFKGTVLGVKERNKA